MADDPRRVVRRPAAPMPADILSRVTPMRGAGSLSDDPDDDDDGGETRQQIAERVARDYRPGSPAPAPTGPVVRGAPPVPAVFAGSQGSSFTFGRDPQEGVVRAVPTAREPASTDRAVRPMAPSAPAPRAPSGVPPLPALHTLPSPIPSPRWRELCLANARGSRAQAEALRAIAVSAEEHERAWLLLAMLDEPPASVPREEVDEASEADDDAAPNNGFPPNG